MSVQALRPQAAANPELEEMRAVFERQLAAATGADPSSASARRRELGKLLGMLLDNEQRFIDAIREDFGMRAPFETRMLEIMPTAMAIRADMKHLGKWMRPERRTPHWAFLPASAKLVPQPLGVVGIISPWNYPLQLALVPAAAALAAGNRVMIKISEYSPRFGALLQELVAKTFDPELVSVVLGGPEVAAAFSGLPFHHILFTGSTSIGRHVMRAAADNLTPVTLELGGKSPTVVAPDYSVDEAAPAIAFGKYLNAGQTCVAPDYVMVPESKRDAFVAAMRKAVERFYPKFEDNDEYTSIINDRHYKRLQGYLEDAEAKGATIVRVEGPEGPEKAETRKMRPTFVLDVTEDMKIMQDEIFGPLLPVLTYRDFNESIEYINRRPRPLAAYLYSNDGSTQSRFAKRTISGGLCFNTSTIHVGVDDLPFGGVGDSGMGAYHGREGFLTFSHHKPVFKQLKPATPKMVYPPYSGFARKLTQFIKGK